MPASLRAGSHLAGGLVSARAERASPLPEPQLTLLELRVAASGELEQSIEVGWLEVVPEVLQVALHDRGRQAELLGFDRRHGAEVSEPGAARFPEPLDQRLRRSSVSP